MSRTLRGWWEASLRESGLVVVVVGAGSLLLIGAAIAAAYATGIPPSSVVTDPSAALAQGRLVGIISLAGVLLWAVAAAIAFFASSLVSGRDRSFLAAFGALSTWLAIDDQFMVHDAAFLDDVPGGEQLYAVAYGVIVLALAVRFRASLPGKHLLVLLLAVTLLGLSVVADVLSDTFDLGGGDQRIIEDTFKFLGICYWAAFAALRARALILNGRPLPRQ